MKVIGLTGSIGMGKSTTAQMFRDLGVPVHDADAAVHALYSGRAAPLVESLFTGTTRNGVVDRAQLAARVLSDAEALRRLEAAIHPLVREEERKFLDEAAATGAAFAVIDVPLLFETGGDARVDGVIVVSADKAEQRRRVLARPAMTAEKFANILSRQLPDAEKRRRADFIVLTDHGLDDARRQVGAIAARIRSGDWTARARKR